MFRIVRYTRSIHTYIVQIPTFLFCFHVLYIGILVRQEERIKANEETFKLYQNELENRALRIKRLEMQLSIQSDQIYSLKKELARLKCESTPPASPNNIIFNSSSASPQSSHSASTVPEDSSSSSSSSSSAELWKVKEALAIMASEHSKTAAELSAVNETIMHYKTLGTTTDITVYCSCTVTYIQTIILRTCICIVRVV